RVPLPCPTMNPALVITMRIEPVAAYDEVGIPAKIPIADRVTRSAFNHRIIWPLVLITERRWKAIKRLHSMCPEMSALCQKKTSTRKMPHLENQELPRSPSASAIQAAP